MAEKVMASKIVVMECNVFFNVLIAELQIIDKFAGIYYSDESITEQNTKPPFT